jgi:hypothetical protein
MADGVGKGLMLIGSVEILPFVQAFDGVTLILPALDPIVTLMLVEF